MTEVRTELELELPARPEYVGAARQAIAALALLHGVTDETLADAKLVVSEACTNAVGATGDAGQEAGVLVRAGLDGSAMVLEVFDRGRGRGPSWSAGRGTAPSFEDASAMGEPAFDGDLSLSLVRELAHEVEAAPREGGGNFVRVRLPWAPPGGASEVVAR